jgi:hypothetical protein
MSVFHQKNTGIQNNAAVIEEELNANYRNLNELKKAQQKEIDMMATYKNLVNNMPLL